MKKYVSMLLAAAMLLCLCAIGPAALAAEDGTPVKTDLVFGMPGPIGNYLYGHNACGTESLVWEVFDPIIFTNPVTKEFDSDIVDFEYQDDNTLVLTVKDGVTFTEGETLTGEDILFTIQSEVSPERASRNASKLAIFNLEKSYVGDDGMTVYLVTDQVEASALTNLMIPALSKSWVEANGWDSELWYTAPNGTGPYYVTENKTGISSTVTLKDEVKDGTYWNKDFTTDIETVTGIHYDDKSVMFIDVENGDLDFAFQIDSVDYARIESDGLTNVTGVLLPYDDVQMLSFDIDDGPGADENLRAAIAYGVNWADVALAAWEDYGMPASSILASTMGDVFKDVGQYEYDPALAQEYADKVTGPKELTISIFTDPLYVQECEVIRAYLQQLGITFNTNVTDMATFFANNAQGVGDCDFCRYPNGNISHEPYLCLGNFERNSIFPNTNMGADPEICDLMEAARHTLDKGERAELYGQVQQYFKDHYLAIPIAEVYGAYAYNNQCWAGADIVATNAANLRYVHCLYE